jgi:septum formation protein
MPAPLILASGSTVRRRLLENAGLDFRAVSASVDEDALKARCRAEDRDIKETALILAQAKAGEISAREPGALVVGADQMLELDGRWFDKPESREQAADHPRQFSAKTHRLVTAAVAMRAGERLWQRVDVASMTVRPLGEPFIQAYLDAVGADALASVGAYQLEGRGAQLFEAVEGDFFTILGLPLLALLDFLRQHAMIGDERLPRRSASRPALGTD